MTSNNDILDELSELSPVVARIPRTNVFKVPENYFNELLFNILQLTQEDISPSFQKISAPQSVPEGYFDGLAGNILSKIKGTALATPAEEMEELSPVISGIGNKNVFTVPEGYFENVSLQVLENIEKENAPAKVVEMKKRPAILRYMAAAAIAGVLGISIFKLADNRSGQSGSAMNDPLYAEAKKIVKENSFEAEFNKLSENDIEQYLEESGQNVNAALVASAAQDANLPAEEDYLINDNTLDEFLNKLNVNSAKN